MASVMWILSALVTLATVTSSLGQTRSRPSFCRSNDCPTFSSEQRNGYEVRTMDAATWWVQTTMYMNSASMSWRDSSTAFGRLFSYISGSNSANLKIDMTVPVLTKVQKISGGRYMMTMMFYVSGSQQPPTPRDANVILSSFPQGAQFFVKTFNKYFWANSGDFQRNLASMKNAIGDASLYDDNTHYEAGYESPWHFGIRRYEVWMNA